MNEGGYLWSKHGRKQGQRKGQVIMLAASRRHRYSWPLIRVMRIRRRKNDRLCISNKLIYSSSAKALSIDEYKYIPVVIDPIRSECRPPADRNGNDWTELTSFLTKRYPIPRGFAAHL